MSALFADHERVAEVVEILKRVRITLRAVRRWTTKIENVAGRQADVQLHRAIAEVEKVLTLLGDKS